MQDSQFEQIPYTVKNTRRLNQSLSLKYRYEVSICKIRPLETE